MHYEDAHRILTREYGSSRRCYYCKRRGRKRDFHIDHKTPLSRGGSHALENLCLACAECNIAKHTMTEEEFRNSASFLILSHENRSQAEKRRKKEERRENNDAHLRSIRRKAELKLARAEQKLSGQRAAQVHRELDNEFAQRLAREP
jgi:5-methylcytosine-specific restriction endonuclease McrA